MFSIPPATTMSTSPARIICEAIATAFRPDPQTMLIVVAGTSFGIARADRDLARGVLSEPRRKDAAEHDLVHFLAGDLYPLERGTDSVRAELGGRDILELPAEAAHRRPHGAHDHSIFHHSLLGPAQTRLSQADPAYAPLFAVPRGARKLRLDCGAPCFRSPLVSRPVWMVPLPRSVRSVCLPAGTAARDRVGDAGVFSSVPDPPGCNSRSVLRAWTGGGCRSLFASAACLLAVQRPPINCAPHSQCVRSMIVLCGQCRLIS